MVRSRPAAGRSTARGHSDQVPLLDEGEHAASVDAWLKRSAKDQPPQALVQLFEAAFSALWNRTNVTLGEVTITAIADRVLYSATEKFPLFAAVKLAPTGKLDGSVLRERLGSADASDLKEGLRFVLVEFLTVLGNLTAEILTPELHAELATVALPKALQANEGANSSSDLTGPASKGRRS